MMQLFHFFSQGKVSLLWFTVYVKVKWSLPKVVELTTSVPLRVNLKQMLMSTLKKAP